MIWRMGKLPDTINLSQQKLIQECTKIVKANNITKPDWEKLALKEYSKNVS
jgi:hypothetical protein